MPTHPEEPHDDRACNSRTGICGDGTPHRVVQRGDRRRAGPAVVAILHPIWQWDGEHLVGWIGTGLSPPSAADLAAHPYVSG